jgi:hypothetical protein
VVDDAECGGVNPTVIERRGGPETSPRGLGRAFAVALALTAGPAAAAPLLVFSSYLGGSDTENTAAVSVDAAGHPYLAG